MKAPRHPVSAYPLSWPAGVPRTVAPRRAPFCNFDKATRKRSRKAPQESFLDLRDELRRLGAVNPVISTNLHLRDDGLPYFDATCREHGVAVYWHLPGPTGVMVPYSMPCDSYDRVADNLYAIAKTIEAMRAIERYGATRTAQVFAGFAALPPGADEPAPLEPVKPWREVLGGVYPDDLEPADLLVLAKARYRKASQTAHPDQGGDADRMAELNRAMAQAELELEPPA